MREQLLRLVLCGLVLLSTHLLVTTLHGQSKPILKRSALVMKGEISATHVSRDGKYILFIDWDAFELSVRDLTTGTDRQITHKRSTDTDQYPGNAFMSRGNEMVAYNWYKPDGMDLRVMPLSGGEVRNIDTGGVAARLHGWTPDGRQLLVLKANGLEETADLGFLSIESGRFRRIAQAQASAHARLSPDGTQIVVSELSKQDPTQSDIRLIDCATGTARELLLGPADDYSPDWAPDGRSVVFISDRGGRPRLWRLRLSPDVRQPDPLDDLLDGDLAISGVTREGTVMVGAYDIGGIDSYLATVDWSSGRVEGVRLLRNPPYKGSRRPVPSPDGKRVAILRRGRGYRVRPGWQIPVVQSSDGSQERVYPTALTLRDAPAWYPDGRALLFTMPPEGAVGDSLRRTWRFVRLDLSTGKYEEVGRTDANGLVRIAGLTERSLYYLLGGKQVMALDWKSGTNWEIFRAIGSDVVFTDAAVLGDGDRIALAHRGGSGKTATISVVTPTGKDPVRVGEVEANARPQVVWCSDGKSILVSGSIAGKQGIWRISADGREQQRLNVEEGDINEVRLSQDGRRIAFTRRVPRPREVWAYAH